MRGIVDLQRKGIVLSGQPLLLSTSTGSTTHNPLAYCLPLSTSTSSFIRSNSSSSFLPFVNILWVEETNSGKPNELEVSYVYSVPSANDQQTEDKPEAKFELPYEDCERNLFPSTQILTIEFHNNTPIPDGMKLCDLIMRYSYPFSKFDTSNGFKQQSVFVLINPHSGKGEAMDIFYKQVKPILTSAHCQFTVQKTEYKGHATELATSLDIDQYDTIICASGDGIPYEVINGFYNRNDRAKAFSKINIVQTPGGSGNAMSLSCLGATSASLAALRILKGKPSQCDLMAVSKESSDEVILSFLSQTYGAIAQADIGTEWIRALGSIRFDLGVFYEVITGHKYPCDLAVKYKCKNNDEIYDHYENEVSDPSKTNTTLTELSEDNFTLKYHEYFKRSAAFDSLPTDWEVYDKNVTNNNRIFYAGKMPYISSRTNFFPAALPADGAIDLVVFDARSNFFNTANALISIEKGVHIQDDYVEHCKVEAFRLIPKSKKDCYISVDGEWFPYESFQVEIMQSLLRTILWEGDYTTTGYLENRA